MYEFVLQTNLQVVGYEIAKDKDDESGYYDH